MSSLQELITILPRFTFIYIRIELGHFPLPIYLMNKKRAVPQMDDLSCKVG